MDEIEPDEGTRELRARLAIAVEALEAIAGESDLTCMTALFRMQRRAEAALARIRATRHDQHTLF
ncbi:hypothetical protein [Desulfolutivibrio sulfoxidireducens]|uniref:hypothetical protein n=1 Tax=Desulfolutivibrio sulfoxidireducens TaxID=2773299 RepID=UPI00159D9954|nr:hypothetical protein [Desulfolutivibrio sulfoxidireducens]QLA15160.1 hypothetical protein GD605_02905 [Desulfolutivibrio sulfoxidireducens]QLA18731.1 hypothetical protein GD604_02800 [Desulfolutivibrio sulfoxidireducens]